MDQFRLKISSGENGMEFLEENDYGQRTMAMDVLTTSTSPGIVRLVSSERKRAIFTQSHN